MEYAVPAKVKKRWNLAGSRRRRQRRAPRESPPGTPSRRLSPWAWCFICHLGRARDCCGRLFALMKLDNDVPDHTTISRRKAKLGKVPFYQDKQKTPLHILIDSSGLAVPRRPAAQSTK